MININRKLSDRFNRYTMPKIEAKVEGKGNGIKTVLVNMVDVARALRRPPTYPTKYLGCALGAQTSLGEKGRYIVNGQHEYLRLQELLDGFIEKYVLCPKCTNPETTIDVIKDNIYMKCMACGRTSEVKGKDRTFTYILKNPPDDSAENADKNYKSTSAATVGGSIEDNDAAGTKMRTSIQQKSVTTVASSSNGSDSVSDFYQIGVIETENDVDEYSKYFSSLPKEDPQASSPKDPSQVVWSVDVSEEAVKKRRMEELSSGMSTLTYTEELDLSMGKRLEIFRQFAQPRLEKENCSSQEYLEIQKEVSRLELDSRAIGVVCECLFTSRDLVLKMIKRHTELFRLMVSRGKKVEKCLLGVIEALLKKYHDLIPQINNIFNLLYDLEIVSESSFLRWNQSSSSDYSSEVFLKKLQKHSADFIEWLKNADEDDSEEETQEESSSHPSAYSSNLPSNSVMDPSSNTMSSSVIGNSEKCRANSPSSELTQEEQLELDIDAI